MLPEIGGKLPQLEVHYFVYHLTIHSPHMFVVKSTQHPYHLRVQSMPYHYNDYM